ncbi:MAG: LysR family transcriptional regulator [Sulfuritalea sp.]|nr:LysR family transcriptional regulator [Sulfuritalea sp.]
MSRITKIDLNLVRVFIAIYETGSVTAASERLYLTQPTVSYGLAKLREVLNDKLFVRTHDGMMPTPCAKQTYKRFSGGLAQIDSAVEMTSTFVPAETDRRFRVAMSDIGELIFLPPLLKKLSAVAPQVELEVVQMTLNDVPNWLASAKVDAAVGYLPTICDVTRNTHLFHEHYVCLLRKEHPSIRGKLTLDKFASARHAYVSSSFFGHKHLEDLLLQLGVKVALRIPHFTILPSLISTSDMIVVMPSRVAASFELFGGLKTLPLPIDLPQIEVRLHWDRRHEGLAPHQWFLDILSETLGVL